MSLKIKQLSKTQGLPMIPIAMDATIMICNYLKRSKLVSYSSKVKVHDELEKERAPQYIYACNYASEELFIVKDTRINSIGSISSYE